MFPIFTQQIGPMGFVYTLVVEPMRKCIFDKVILWRYRQWQVRFNQPPELFECSIGKAPPLPLIDNATMVKPKGMRILTPHIDRRVMLPAIGRIEDGAENLEVFNALLTKPLVIEDICRAVIAGQR